MIQVLSLCWLLASLKKLLNAFSFSHDEQQWHHAESWTKPFRGLFLFIASIPTMSNLFNNHPIWDLNQFDLEERNKYCDFHLIFSLLKKNRQFFIIFWIWRVILAIFLSVQHHMGIFGNKEIKMQDIQPHYYLFQKSLL